MLVSVACALGAALLYAAASVLQQRAAAAEPPHRSLRLGLLAGLLRRPSWLLGILADAGAFGLQFAALATGPIAVAQPLLVLSLLFALPLGARISGQHPRGRDLGAAVVACVGLALFLGVAHPAPGDSFVEPRVWLTLLTAGGGSAFVLATLGSRAPAGRGKAVLISASAGVTFGLAAALTKTTSQLIAGHLLGVFGHWELWALVTAGVAGLVLGQSAFQAGSLGVSMPTMTVCDPVVSVLIGALAFKETIAHSALAVVAEAVGLVLTAVGIYALAQSPVIVGAAGAGERPPAAAG